MVKDVGSLGIVLDQKPQFLPTTIWSNGRNVRFRKDRVEEMGGVLEIEPEIAVDIQNVGLVTGTENTYVIMSNLTSLYAYDGFNSTDVSGATYNEMLTSLFDFQIFNGLILANQDQDVPQVWDGDILNNFGNLNNWDTNWRTRFLRKFNSILIALNLTESGTKYAHKLRWSHPAEPGAVPVTWDITDATKLAGEFTFADTDNGVIMNGLQLENEFIVYKEKAIWRLIFVDGVSVFSRRLAISGVGIDVERSLVEIPYGPQGNRVHFFAGPESFYIFDGLKVYPIFEEIFKDAYLELRNENNYKTRSFSCINLDEQEVWFCFPTGTNDFADLALCFNYLTQKYTLRTLGGASTIAYGLGIAGGVATQKTTVIPFADGTFYSDGTGHAVLTVIPGGSSLVEATPATGKMYSVDVGKLDYDGTSFKKYVEKRSIATIKHDSRDPEATIVDYDRIKMVDSVIPKLHKGRMEMEIGIQDDENDEVSWMYSTILPDARHKHDLTMPISGRFISYRFNSVGLEDFNFAGFDYEVSVLGSF